MVLEVKIMLPLGNYNVGGGMKQTSGEMEMFYVLIWLVVTWVYLYLKFHWAVQLRFVNFIEVMQ